ncbi:MAG: translation initiation factor IF-3, partial [Coriobacteriia bacterium]|nr:translation initiation factor IF-3 [Coriobacteriia bacterium]
LERLAGELGEMAIVESAPKLEGRNMFMLMAPTKKELPKKSADDQVEAPQAESVEAAEQE